MLKGQEKQETMTEGWGGLKEESRKGRKESRCLKTLKT